MTANLHSNALKRWEKCGRPTRVDGKQDKLVQCLTEARLPPAQSSVQRALLTPQGRIMPRYHCAKPA